MPVEIQLNGPVHGYAVESALEGQTVTIRIEEFTFSEDGELFRSRLEELPQLLLSLFPSSASIQPPSSVRGACSNMRYVPKSEGISDRSAATYRTRHGSARHHKRRLPFPRVAQRAENDRHRSKREQDASIPQRDVRH